ncbi:Pre-mRNA-splicing factor SPF27 [Pleurostoma richardsiae]|uniref:Pre-mRNA-splicing factor SPF27 n=1 Tax=Pleurostoma richardsiae TaxID=41990 RepID=A0AA38VGI1_9PEZI|nr:Pre-mRNA-splicing factor SPF27 [Pleurostoma richardsiae]
MPLITSAHESLPYIDPEPTPAERAAAEALIAMERSSTADDPSHALLPPPFTPAFSALIDSELSRIASAPDPSRPPPTRAVDLARYEAPDLPDLDSSDPSAIEPALSRAYASAAYLSARRQHLALLDSHGRNAWLVGNWQLEGELAALERELAAARREVDLVTIARRRAQDEVAGEVRSLEDGWKRGVARVLETEVAAEGVRREVLEARRRQE